MMPLSTFAFAASGWTTRPPSIATHALCTRILPVARSSEISATPAPSEPERSLIEMPSARPSGRGAFQSDICTAFSNTARARGEMDMRWKRKSTGSMPRSTAISSTNDSIAKTLKTWPTARQCFRRTPWGTPRISMC